MKTKFLFVVLCTLSSFFLTAQEWNPNPASSTQSISRSGNVGIGTSSPAAMLSVGGVGNNGYTGFFQRNTSSNVTGGMAVYGKVFSPKVASAKTTGVMGYAITGEGLSKGVAGHSSSSQPKPGTAHGGYFYASNGAKNFGVTGIAGGQVDGIAVLGWDKKEHLGSGVVNYTKSYAGFFLGDLFVSGDVGIGVEVPANKLDVCGTIRSLEVKVESGWCDYVFNEEYNMPSLEEEETFINANGHLLSFESEATMDGEIQLGDVTKRQQESIEKLMLHVIELNKEIKALKAQVESGK